MAFKFVAPRAYGGYDADALSDETGLACKDPSLTVQSDAADADINIIVQRFGIGAVMPTDMDLSRFVNLEDAVVDYRTALDYVRAGAAEFMRMPADVRTRFGNDPQQFMDFVHDPKNGDELVKLGLREPVVVKEPAPVKVIVEPAPVVAPK